MSDAQQPQVLRLGTQIRRARHDSGRSQEWVALRADIDRSHLSQLENDLKSPTIETLARICDALGVRVSELVASAEAVE